MIRMTLKFFSIAAAAAATLFAAPVFASDNSSGDSALALRNTVIAMSMADAAMPAATAATQAAPATVEAMGAMPARAVRRARQVAYDRRIRLARSDLACSSLWCSRFPALILGIGF